MQRKILIPGLILLALATYAQDLPQPKVVGPVEDWNPPSDAVILFDGKSLSNAEIKGPTTAYNKELPENATQGPLMFQDHNNKVSYRNIWLRKLEL